MSAVEAVIEDLLAEESARGLADKSHIELKRNLGRFVKWPRTPQSAAEITPPLLLEYLLAEYGDKGFSTTKSAVWTLRKLGEHLEFHGHLDCNPAAALRHPKQSARKKLPEFLSETEIRQWLTHLTQSADLLPLTVVSLFLNTGLRPGDLENIRLFQYFPQRGYFTGIAKGKKNKRTPLSDSLILILNEYISQRDDCCEFLLVNSRGEQLKVPALRQIVKNSAKDAGLGDVTPRLLRHTFATHLTDRHGTIMCKALLGHGSHRNTRVYAHLSPDRFRQAMNLHPFNREAHLYV